MPSRKRANSVQDWGLLSYNIDSKSFDCVNHPTLWNMMEEMGIPEHMVQVIRSLYANQ